MTAIPTSAPVVPGRLEQMSTRIAFFIAGFGIAAWAPLVPYAKARAELSEGTLGLLLLCLGGGLSSPCRPPVRWRLVMAADAC
ncbi:hypothetical protein [Pseudomonas sp. 8 R 14]|nr:hypothetical protein [Pseudomonas sp. 8 R 14]